MSRSSRKHFLSIVLWVFVTPAAFAADYTVTELATSSDWASSWATGINSSGLVVGGANVRIGTDSFGNAISQVRPVVWNNNSFQYLPLLQGGNYGVANAINNQG